jgi:multidrug efflux pump
MLSAFPPVISRGAGAEMRRTLGTAVFAGMIGVALFGIFFAPVLFYAIRGLGRRHTPRPKPISAATPETRYGHVSRGSLVGAS